MKRITNKPTNGDRIERTKESNKERMNQEAKKERKWRKKESNKQKKKKEIQMRKKPAIKDKAQHRRHMSTAWDGTVIEWEPSHHRNFFKVSFYCVLQSCVD